jgi:hypothetical protein
MDYDSSFGAAMKLTNVLRSHGVFVRKKRIVSGCGIYLQEAQNTQLMWDADAMTKSKAGKALRDLIDTNKLSVNVIGWVERD